MPPKKRPKTIQEPGITAYSAVTTIDQTPSTIPTKSKRMCCGVPIIAEYDQIDEPKLEAICSSKKFISWIEGFGIHNDINIHEFHVTDVNFFGSVSPEKLGFVKGFGVAVDAKTGEVMPAIAFIRGGAVAVLIVVTIKDTNEKYILMCEQARFPVGKKMIEACAGMLDNNTSTVIGVVFNEVREETGFILSEADLIPLGQIAPSPGGCDEIIHLYAWETTITRQEFEEKQRNVFGEGPHERIKLLFYPIDEFDAVLDNIGDVKAECCWRRYQNIKIKEKGRKRSSNRRYK